MIIDVEKRRLNLVFYYSIIYNIIKGKRYKEMERENMKQTFKTCLVCLMVLVFSLMTVCAVGADYTVSYSGGDSEIVIQGTAGVEKANRQITLQVIREGVSVTDPGFAPDTDILYMRQVMTDVNGDFNFAFTVAARGEHSIRISESGSLLTGDGTFYRSTAEELADAVLQLNGAYNNAAAMDAVICGNSAVAPNESMMKILQIDAAEYASLKTDAYFLSNLASKNNYADVPEFMAQYELSALLVNLTRATTADEVKALLEGDNAFDFTAKNAGVTFDAYSDADKLDIYEAMADKTYETADDIANALYEAVIVKELVERDTYQAKFGVLESNNDVLGLDLSKCTTLGTYVEGFKSELATQPLDSIDDIRTSFDTLYTRHLTLKQDAERDNGSGGGGGGTGRPSFIEVGKGEDEGFKPTPVPSGSFSDIDSVAWAKEAIESLAAKGVIAGKAKDTFAPYDSITRAEFAKILFGAFGMVDESASTEFIDVPGSHWAYQYVATAYTKGLVNGVGDGVFGANYAITRQDIVTLCYRLTEYLGVALPEANSAEFDDSANIAPYAKVAADKMKAAGIVNGKGGNVFDPTAPATRAEATKIIYEVMQYCQK